LTFYNLEKFFRTPKNPEARMAYL